MGEVLERVRITRALVLDPDLFFTATGPTRLEPDHRLLGVPVVIRTLRQLQDAGITHSHLLLPASRSSLETLIRDDFRITHQVTVHTVRDDLAAVIGRVAQDIDGGLVVARADWVGPAAVLGELLGENPEGLWVLAEDVDQGIRERRLCAADAGLWRLTETEAPRPKLLGFLVLDEARRLELARSGELDELVNTASEAGTLHLVGPGARWALPVYDPASQQEAEARLLHGLRKPIDGFIARSINRRISIPISRLLANTFLTPNMASGFTLILAFLAVWALLHGEGGYFWTLLAALLFQFASIIDGVDGEIARLKYQFTKYGEWVDTVIDDISNFAFFTALTYVAYTSSAGFWAVAFGVLTVGCYCFITPLMYAYIIKYTDSGDVMAIDFSFNKPRATDANSLFVRAMAQVKNIAKRDFFIFMIFVFALFGVLPKFLFVSGTVAVFILLAVVLQHRKKRAELAAAARQAGALDEQWRWLTRDPGADAATSPSLDSPRDADADDEDDANRPEDRDEPTGQDTQGDEASEPEKPPRS